MGNFSKYLKENEEQLALINDILVDMDEEEIDEFGYVLYVEFFEEDDIESLEDDDFSFFSIEDVQEMITILGSDMYDYILDLLDEESEEDEMDEAVSRRMKTSNMNRKKRKFMSNTKADLRKTKAVRKKAARLSRADRKRYYRANKKKIISYQKSRGDAIKKGKHKVKLRRNA